MTTPAREMIDFILMVDRNNEYATEEEFQRKQEFLFALRLIADPNWEVKDVVVSSSL